LECGTATHSANGQTTPCKKNTPQIRNPASSHPKHQTQHNSRRGYHHRLPTNPKIIDVATKTADLFTILVSRIWEYIYVTKGTNDGTLLTSALANNKTYGEIIKEKVPVHRT
jgi:hypothetical protein